MTAILHPNGEYLDLPGPTEHPEADLVIFDGNCRFCWQQIDRLRSYDRYNRLAYLSLHDPQVAERFPDLTHDQLMQQMYVVDPKGGRHGGVNALRYLSGRLPGLWWARLALNVPLTLPIWSWLYRRVAERRYKLSGQPACDNGSCDLHFKKK